MLMMIITTIKIIITILLLLLLLLPTATATTTTDTSNTNDYNNYNNNSNTYIYIYMWGICIWPLQLICRIQSQPRRQCCYAVLPCCWFGIRSLEVEGSTGKWTEQWSQPEGGYFVGRSYEYIYIHIYIYESYVYFFNGTWFTNYIQVGRV